MCLEFYPTQRRSTFSSRDSELLESNLEWGGDNVMAHCFENDQLSEHVRSEVGGIICHRREFDWLTIVWWADRIYPSGVTRGRRQGDLDTCHPRIKAADGLKYSVQ